MAGFKLITGPTIEPITLAEARLHLRLDATGSPAAHPDDSLVTNLIAAVRQNLDGRDGRLQRCLITQTWERILDAFPVNEIRVPLPPLQDVLSVKYDDVNGTEKTISPIDYVVDKTSATGWILPVTGKSWPATFDSVNAVRIQFKGGYGDAAANVPGPIKAAMLLMLGHLYENRGDEEMPPFPSAVDALLSPYEVVTIV